MKCTVYYGKGVDIMDPCVSNGGWPPADPCLFCHGVFLLLFSRLGYIRLCSTCHNHPSSANNTSFTNHLMTCGKYFGIVLVRKFVSPEWWVLRPSVCTLLKMATHLSTVWWEFDLIYQIISVIHSSSLVQLSHIAYTTSVKLDNVWPGEVPDVT